MKEELVYIGWLGIEVSHNSRLETNNPLCFSSQSMGASIQSNPFV